MACPPSEGGANTTVATSDWSPQALLYVGWPCRVDTWRDGARPAQRAILVLVNAILENTAQLRMTVLVSDAEGVLEEAREHFGALLAPRTENVPPRVSLLALPMDDCWVRDTGPIYVARTTRSDAGDDGSEIYGACFGFNAWGGECGGCYADYAADAGLARRLSQHCGMRTIESEMILEGGSISSDGRGTLLTTRECLLHENRNPSLTQHDIARVLTTHLGARHIIWLPHGAAHDSDTNGHVDNAAIFIAPHTVLVHDGNDARTACNLRALRAARDASGHALTIHTVRAPGAVTRAPREAGVAPGARTRPPGERVCASYVNVVFAEALVLAPAFGEPGADAAARLQLERAFAASGRRVVMVAAREFVLAGGGMHCLTLGVPLRAR